MDASSEPVADPVAAKTDFNDLFEKMMAYLKTYLKPTELSKLIKMDTSSEPVADPVAAKTDFNDLFEKMMAYLKTYLKPTELSKLFKKLLEKEVDLLYYTLPKGCHSYAFQLTPDTFLHMYGHDIVSMSFPPNFQQQFWTIYFDGPKKIDFYLTIKDELVYQGNITPLSPDATTVVAALMKLMKFSDDATE